MENYQDDKVEKSLQLDNGQQKELVIKKEELSTYEQGISNSREPSTPQEQIENWYQMALSSFKMGNDNQVKDYCKKALEIIKMHNLADEYDYDYILSLFYGEYDSSD